MPYPISKRRRKSNEFALNELIKCGECEYCVTVEAHTKKYKNGTSKTFAYYRCTKTSKTKKCSQPYISANKLEDKVIEELSKFELDQEFAEWALEALGEVKEKEQDTSADSLKALQSALDGVNKRLHNLLALKISPDNSDGSMLSDNEFAERKRLLISEKDKIIQQLNATDPMQKEWAEIGKDSFNFALLACKKFKETEDPNEKKLIARTVGSKLILLYQELLFQPRFLFLKYKEGIARTKAEIKRLVPNNSLSNQANLEYFVKSCIWYRQRESNPRFPG